MKILITGARSYVAYSLIKLANLRKNIDIFVGDSQKKSLCFQSKFFSEKVIFPSPRYDFNNFRIFITKYVVDKNINIIYPTCEEVFYFSMIKDDLEKKGIQVFCDTQKVLETLHSKYKFIRYVSNFSIKVPHTFIINKLSHIKKYNDKKYIFKYEYSRFGNKIYTNFCNKDFKNIDEIKQGEGKLIAQEYIQGEKICAWGLAKNGKLLSNIIYKAKLNYKGGPATFIENIHNKQVHIFVEDLVKDLGFTGFISFDFIHLGDKVYVIECNPRMTSGIHLFDENDTLSSVIFEEKKYSTFFPNKKVYKTFLLPNIFSNMKYFFQQRAAYKFKNEVLQKEKKLFLYQLFLLFYYLYLSIKTHKSIAELTTSDIEYNG